MKTELQNTNLLERPSIHNEHIEKFRGGGIVDEEIYGFLDDDLIKQDLSGKNVLDLGCSDGERLLAQLVGREAKNIYGIDNQEAAIKDVEKMKARKKEEGLDVSNLVIFNCDYTKEKMPFPDKTLDIIACIFSFDARGLEEIKRVLKDDGKLIIGCTVTEILDNDFINQKIIEAAGNGEKFKFPIVISRGNDVPSKNSSSYLSPLDEKLECFKQGGWKIDKQFVFVPKNIKINHSEGVVDFSKYIKYQQGYFVLSKEESK